MPLFPQKSHFSNGAAASTTVASSCTRTRQTIAGIGVFGFFQFKCLDKHGQLKWEETAKNGTTTVGLTYLIGTGFVQTAQIAAANWYIGLINNAPVPSLQITDTMASHAGWVEVTSYSEATRPAWTPTVSGSPQATNTSPRVFTMTAPTLTVAGAFIVGGAPATADVKGGTGGTMYSTGSLQSPQLVSATDVLQITYITTLSAL